MLFRASRGATLGLLLVLNVSYGQDGPEDALESARPAAAPRVSNQERAFCEHRQRLDEFRIASQVSDESKRLDELLLSLGEDNPRVTETRALIEERERQRDAVASRPLDDCFDQARIELLRRDEAREEARQKRLNTSPTGVTSEEWAQIRADIAERHRYDDILDARVWPIPTEGCPGIDASQLVETRSPLGASSDLPPCSLVMTIVDWDALMIVRFLRVQGEWIIED